MKGLILALGLTVAAAGSMCAQVTERALPKEWNQLVMGARHMDRFLPMREGKLAQGTWGAPGVRPRYVDNGIEADGTSFWGGNIIRTPDNMFHLFVCGWPENSPEGHMYWPNSTVYHAVSSNPDGPYAITDTIGQGHNPEAFVLDDGRVVLYVIGGRYVADSVNGPWTYGKFDFDARDRNIIEGLSNLTFARRPDGSRLMVCRGGGVWVSRTGLSPYCQLTDKRVYPDVDGQFEDPVVWRDSLQYHLIVNDWLGRIAFYERSLDGIHWVVEQGEAYTPDISFHKDGRKEEWFKYERAKVLQDAEGRVEQMNFAVIDTIKWEDKPGDTHSSKNICIPMNKGLLLSVLNRKPITARTKAISLLVRKEKGFSPAEDLDIESLRFGSYNEVNFGRGARPTRHYVTKEGNLVVVFSGEGSGITPDEFAPKLIGRDRRGEMVFGYASLPYVDYRPAYLSARCPVYDKATGRVSVTVENFGLKLSRKAKAKLYSGDTLLATGTVKRLRPYESVLLSLEVNEGTSEEKPDLRVVLEE